MSGTPRAGLVERSDIEWRRRIMIFGDSIRSDFDNPLATSWRAIMRSLTRTGHEVVFIEPRRGESLTRLLRHRGSEPLRQFAERYPDLQYRTLDLPRGRELGIWLARELALVDAVVVLDNAASGIKTEIAEFDEPRLLRVEQTEAGYKIIGQTTSLDLGPAIDLASTRQARSPGQEPGRIAVLVWDAEQSSLATQTRHAVDGVDPTAPRYSLGSMALDEWVPITELDLGPVLADCDLAIVIETEHPAGPASTVRSLLPWSFGVRTLTVSSHPGEGESHLPGPVVGVQSLAVAIEQTERLPWPDLGAWSADRRAAVLIDAIDRSRAALRAKRA